MNVVTEKSRGDQGKRNGKGRGVIGDGCSGKRIKVLPGMRKMAGNASGDSE